MSVTIKRPEASANKAKSVLTKSPKPKKPKPEIDGRGRPKTSPTTLGVERIEAKVDEILRLLKGE
jgi:hypothetical protein